MSPGRFAITAAALPMILLAGCSEYLDRRDTIVESGGNALASNAVTQMVDPWPSVSRDRNIPFDGQRMQRAVERYRTNKVTPREAPRAVLPPISPQPLPRHNTVPWHWSL